MKKSISRIIGLIMLIIAIVFIMFALNHRKYVIIRICQQLYFSDTLFS